MGFLWISGFSLRLRIEIAVRRGKMAADEEGKNEPPQLNLTITEDQNSPTKENLNTPESDEVIEPYKNGFGLGEYYKLCLKYYHKEKKIIKISYDDKLQLTAFWKQVTCGSYDPDKLPDVGYFDVIGNDRRKAWEALGNMSHTEAMENFCILLEECSPELKPWMEAQHREVEEMKRKKKEEEERQRRMAEEAAERERQRLAEEEARKRAEEEERRRNEEIIKQQELIKKQEEQQKIQHNQVDGLQHPAPSQHKEESKQSLSPASQTTRILPASLWTRPKVTEFIQHVKSDPNSVLVVGRGETMTVRVPTHDSGTCLFWEFATEDYDLGFGVSFEWSVQNGTSQNITIAVNESDEDEFAEEDDKPIENDSTSSPPRPRVDEILPVVRRPCHEEVIVGSHMYPGKGVYLLKFDNSYSLFRSKTLYYRVYYTR